MEDCHRDGDGREKVGVPCKRRMRHGRFSNDERRSQRRVESTVDMSRSEETLVVIKKKRGWTMRRTTMRDWRDERTWSESMNINELRKKNKKNNGNMNVQSKCKWKICYKINTRIRTCSHMHTEMNIWDYTDISQESLFHILAISCHIGNTKAFENKNSFFSNEVYFLIIFPNRYKNTERAHVFFLPLLPLIC